MKEGDSGFWVAVAWIVKEILAFLKTTGPRPQITKGDVMAVGIQETKEALIAVNECAVVLARAFKDGVQFTDFIQFYEEFTKNDQFRVKLEAAWNNYQAIPEEVKDLDIGEVIELASVEITYVPKIIAELHG